MTDGQIIDLLLRGTAVGAQLGLGLALARSAGNNGLRLATLLFIASNISFTLNGSPPLARAFGPVQLPLWLIQIGGAGFFWLFAVTLFEDRRLGWTGAVPPVLLIVIGITGQYGPRATAPLVWGAHNLIGLGLAVHALVVIVRSGRTDLVEARRRLRVPFLLLVAGFSVLISAVQIGQGLGYDAGWYGLANAAVQALLGVAGVAVLLEARPILFGVAAGDDGRRAPGIDAAPSASETRADTQMWLDRLAAAMANDRPWRREGLTIADLATEVGLPEHRLRRLINIELGHRNFATFVNQHRVAAAQALLADPAQSARSVASIAFDLGFGSLGPFNRAFREATGSTPTDYRRAQLAQGSPIPENPR